MPNPVTGCSFELWEAKKTSTVRIPENTDAILSVPTSNDKVNNLGNRPQTVTWRYITPAWLGWPVTYYRSVTFSFSNQFFRNDAQPERKNTERCMERLFWRKNVQFRGLVHIRSNLSTSGIKTPNSGLTRQIPLFWNENRLNGKRLTQTTTGHNLTNQQTGHAKSESTIYTHWI